MSGWLAGWHAFCKTTTCTLTMLYPSSPKFSGSPKFSQDTITCNSDGLKNGHVDQYIKGGNIDMVVSKGLGFPTHKTNIEQSQSLILYDLELYSNYWENIFRGSVQLNRCHFPENLPCSYFVMENQNLKRKTISFQVFFQNYMLRTFQCSGLKCNSHPFHCETLQFTW